jgi:hypothetical protein
MESLIHKKLPNQSFLRSTNFSKFIDRLPAKSLVGTGCGSVVKCEILNEKRSRVRSSAQAKSAPDMDTKSNNRGIYYRQFAALSIHHEVKI